MLCILIDRSTFDIWWDGAAGGTGWWLYKSYLPVENTFPLSKINPELQYLLSLSCCNLGEFFAVAFGPYYLFV